MIPDFLRPYAQETSLNKVVADVVNGIANAFTSEATAIDNTQPNLIGLVLASSGPSPKAFSMVGNAGLLTQP